MMLANCLTIFCYGEITDHTFQVLKNSISTNYPLLIMLCWILCIISHYIYPPTWILEQLICK